MKETLFQIAARLPQSRKDEFEEYLEDVKRRKELKPKETIEDIIKDA